jgi:hypothetical protein
LTPSRRKLSVEEERGQPSASACRLSTVKKFRVFVVNFGGNITHFIHQATMIRKFVLLRLLRDLLMTLSFSFVREDNGSDTFFIACMSWWFQLRGATSTTFLIFSLKVA